MRNASFPVGDKKNPKQIKDNAFFFQTFCICILYGPGYCNDNGQNAMSIFIKMFIRLVFYVPIRDQRKQKKNSLFTQNQGLIFGWAFGACARAPEFRGSHINIF